MYLFLLPLLLLLIILMYDISADNANKKPKKNNIQKLSLLRSFKHLLGRLHSHADCHNRKLHYKELLKLYIPDRSIRGRASGEGTKETREVANGSLRSEINQPNWEILRPCEAKIMK